MKSLTLLIKPASGLCNMRCTYCFYEDVAENRAQKYMGIMTEATAERIICEAFRAISPGGMITFMFQGGEPTLAGLDFFYRFMELEKMYRKADVTCHHAIQTNGYCVNREWAVFFRDNQFLVGLSMDGTEAIHDHFRLDASGHGTWKQAIGALHLLEEFHVETNILCVVTAQAAKKANQIYKNLSQIGHPMQFIPCLDPLETERGALSHSLKPDAYGKFLCQLFDCWYRDWKAGHFISIRTFDDYIRHLLRMPPSSCAAAGSCGHYLVCESNGNLYPCDFYVLDHWYLGNIHDCTIEEAMNSATALAFLEEGAMRPSECHRCRYLPLCRGGCKRDWDKSGGNYYCTSYKTFFPYAISRLEEVAAALYRRR